MESLSFAGFSSSSTSGGFSFLDALKGSGSVFDNLDSSELYADRCPNRSANKQKSVVSLTVTRSGLNADM